jgi:Protein of unknown function (DUF3775)
VRKEPVEFFGSMNEDEQRELIALYLIGGVDFPVEGLALSPRRRTGGRGRAAFLLGMPNAAGQLEPESAIFGFSRVDGRL